MERLYDIAVIGIGCNFPGGEGLDSFWKLLLEGKNCAVDIPVERFDTTFWFDADDNKPGKTQTTRAALIEGFDEFDCKFFGVSEVEADYMDPQQKLLLQCSYRALEDAGIAMETISGSRTGVYIGLMNRDYEMLRSNSPSTITHYSSTGSAMSIAANRISFTFNLTGPSFAIDSACSSSLVALHVACQAIKQGDCDMALCGGVNCIIEPRVFVALSKAKMISAGGTSKPFSRTADGYGRGEGCGVVLLKLLKKAKEHGNKIWGIISKTAVNQDGHCATPITKPSMDQQEELLRQIYSHSDIANVQYIEAHGTGTPVGDPTEMRSISNAIAKNRSSDSETLLIGSVKGNIGHTESAAGVAGLIKVLLMMKHETIVPSVFSSENSTSIDIKSLHLNIPVEVQRWETNGLQGRMAGINSFGFGGTNAHVILRECNHTTLTTQTKIHCPNVFVLSAATERSLILTMMDTQERLRSDQRVDTQALCYTSACGRSHYKHKYRKVFPSSSLSELEHNLSSTLKTKVESTTFSIHVVFVFCGSGVAYRGMCRHLMRKFAVFREKVREIETVFQRYNTTGISEALAGEPENKDFRKPDVAQPLLFAMQVGIETLLKHWGVKPDATLGHSVGEVAAAHCSGLLSLEDAVKVLHYRSIHQSKVLGGKMLVVGNVDVKRIVDILPVFSGKACIAAFNSPVSCTLSGDAEAVDDLHKRLKSMFSDQNVFLHVLDVPAAYHSHMMDPVMDDIERGINVLEANNMKCELFSTITGGKYSDGDFTSGRYWAKNTRDPVLFEKALKAVIRDKPSRGKMVFVEIGPRRALYRNICETLGADTVVLSSADSNDDCNITLSTVAKLFELGVNVNWHQLYKGCEALLTPLPVYQFDNTKRKLNFEALRKGQELFPVEPHLLIHQIKHNKDFVYTISAEKEPYLWEHKVNHVPIMPGAFYVELVFASVMTNLKLKIPVSQLHLSVRFESVLTLNSNCQKLRVILEHKDKEVSFKIQSAAATHASGTYRCTESQFLLEESKICVDVINQRCKLILKREEIYSFLALAGFQYGPLFKQLDCVCIGSEFKETVTVIRVPGELLKHFHEYYIHPVLLDYFLQMTAVLAMGYMTAKQGFPSGIGSITISGPLQEEMIIYMKATQQGPDYLDVCGCFSTLRGDVLVELKGVRISFLRGSSNVPQSLFFHDETSEIAVEQHLHTCKMKAIVFEDNLGIARRLRPYVSPESILVERKQDGKADQIREFVLESLRNNVDIENILFIWGVEDLSHLSCEQVLDGLVTCCDIFRQTVLGLKESKHLCTVHVITYRSTGKTADHVNSGFVLSGMLRACAAEMPSISFQLVDLASVTTEDIETLARVINTCKQQDIRINRGQASAATITRTSMKDSAMCDEEKLSMFQQNFALQTSDPYKMTHLSAIAADTIQRHIQGKSVEIQLGSVCMHSADYFPVSCTHWSFGKTMYWSKHTSQNHKLLALDFSGVVTAVGKDVHNLRVGDHVASSYPVVAMKKITIPEGVCYSTKTLPFLKETSCVSYYILAWSIMQRVLSEVQKQHRKLCIITSNSASVLTKVLALTANRSGWKVSSQTHFSQEPPHFDDSHAFIFLPPFNLSWQEVHDSGGSEKHMIFVCSSPIAPPAETMFASKCDHIHVHKLDVPNVLQKANLLAQNKDIISWLQSLGFDTPSVPLRKELYHSSGMFDPQNNTDHESYFTANTVRQVVLNNGTFDCPVSDIPLLMQPKQLFQPNCVYVVSGGLSGLGFETVKFIAQNGGGCIATLSRSTLSDEKQIEVDLLQKRYGVRIMHIQCDVSVSKQVVDAMSKIKQRFMSCPVKGVFHSAAVLHDALIEALDEPLFRKVLQPKVLGALNLHYATLHYKLDFFVCYSSISSFIGNASQCNYAAANSFLDSFCHYRRNLGLAGQSINWGPVNLGLLLNKSNFQKFLEAKGMMTMNVCEVHETLKKCLVMNRPQQVICKFNFQNLNIHVLSQNKSLRERLSALVEVELKYHVCKESPAHHVSCTYENVKAMVSLITNLSVDELDDDSTLGALGFDSMSAMTLQNQIFQETGLNVPLITILDPNSTLAKLAADVSKNG
uniref:Reducing polyketide synthase FUB1-like n=1 Tax=Salarias fasciatus TaxID=181472 RepID=A0A672J9Z4_SALFA